MKKQTIERFGIVTVVLVVVGLVSVHGDGLPEPEVIRTDTPSFCSGDAAPTPCDLLRDCGVESCNMA